MRFSKSGLPLWAFCVIALAVAIGPVISSQTRPNFSGIWTFVPSPPGQREPFARLWSGDPVTITQDQTTISIEYVSGSRAHAPVKAVYNLDGSERKNIDRNSLPASQERLLR